MYAPLDFLCEVDIAPIHCAAQSKNQFESNSEILPLLYHWIPAWFSVFAKMGEKIVHYLMLLQNWAGPNAENAYSGMPQYTRRSFNYLSTTVPVITLISLGSRLVNCQYNYLWNMRMNAGAFWDAMAPIGDLATGEYYNTRVNKENMLWCKGGIECWKGQGHSYNQGMQNHYHVVARAPHAFRRASDERENKLKL